MPMRSVFLLSILAAVQTSCASGAMPAAPPPVEAEPRTTLASIQAVEAQLDAVAQAVAVAETFTTQENAQTPFNLDLAADLPFAKVKRYTVSFTAPPAMLNVAGNSISVRTGVLQTGPLQTTDVAVFVGDEPGANAAAIGPYVGSNSFISVVRGNDGLGPLDVKVNAYIEVLP